MVTAESCKKRVGGWVAVSADDPHELVCWNCGSRMTVRQWVNSGRDGIVR